MANRAHVALLRAGAAVWNEWRQTHSRVRPNLRDANLAGRELAGYDLAGADLTYANLTAADLTGSTLLRSKLTLAKLTLARLQRANLQTANLSSADIINAHFDATILVDADLSGCNISDTSFDNADLQGARFTSSTFHDVSLRGANLQKAVFNRASFVRVDLTCATVGATAFSDAAFFDVIGLDTLRHEYPSSVGIDTFFNSGGLPEPFLRGAGVPDEFITYAGSLLGKAIEYYSCFVSFSTYDTDFARRLHADLQALNIRTWFAPDDLKIGDRFRARIDESIRVHEKLVLVLSQHAVESAWVETEVEAAYARERRERRDVLFPIRIDDSVFQSDHAWASNIVNTRHIGDFRDWQRHDRYVAALDRLVRDLKKEGPILMG